MSFDRQINPGECDGAVSFRLGRARLPRDTVDRMLSVSLSYLFVFTLQLSFSAFMRFVLYLLI